MNGIWPTQWRVHYTFNCPCLLCWIYTIFIGCILYVCVCVCLFSIIYSFYKLQDVAVKVLTIQDFHDDQLKEFLREVCIHETFIEVPLCCIVCVWIVLTKWRMLPIWAHSYLLIINYLSSISLFYSCTLPFVPYSFLGNSVFHKKISIYNTSFSCLVLCWC